MIAIIDYGMGNVRSVRNICEVLGAEIELTKDPKRLEVARGIILPGVGAFGDGIAALRDRGLVDPIKEQVLAKHKPFLGLCLGMQMLASRGTEHGEQIGLDLIAGTVNLMTIPKTCTNLRLPHIGWNTVHFKKADGLYAELKGQADFYFVHSYVFSVENQSIISGECEHGNVFAASIEQDNIWATQFHPEKSHKNGLALFSSWLKKVSRC